MNRISTAVVSVILTLVATLAARSESLTYEIEFAPQGSPADTPLTMFCSDRSQCRGEIELHIGEQVQPATVDPLFTSSLVHIVFGAQNMPLTVNGQKSVNVPLDSAHTGHVTLTVRGPALPEERGPAMDLVARIVEWPVKPFTKTVDVNIRPSR